MDYTEALNLMMNFNSGIRRKNWEKERYIAFSDGKEFALKDPAQYLLN